MILFFSVHFSFSLSHWSLHDLKVVKLTIKISKNVIFLTRYLSQIGSYNNVSYMKVHIVFSQSFFWASKPTVLPFRMSVRARFKLRCEANTQVHLLSPSEMSRTSAWTCWDTRGRSSAQLSSSGPIWCRGRWRCEIHPSERSVPRISVVLTFLCLLGLVSEAFLPAEHLKKPKQRERIHFSSATPESCTTTRGDDEETRPPASHPTQWTAERCTTGSCSPSQSEVRELLWRRRKIIWRFSLRFHFIIVGLLRSSPMQSYLCTVSSVAITPCYLSIPPATNHPNWEQNKL